MSWTTPRTWAADEVITSARLNTHLRDNLNALADGPYSVAATPAGVEDLTSDTTFPANLTRSVDVPSWAVTGWAMMHISKCWAATDTLNHILEIRLGSLVFRQQRLRWTTAAVPVAGHQDVLGFGRLDVSSVAGTTQTFRCRGARVSGSGALRVDSESRGYAEVWFSPRAEP